MTLRLRLTLVYGAVFITAGGALLAVSYALFKHNQSRSRTAITVSGPNFELPAGVGSWFVIQNARAPSQTSVHTRTPPSVKRVAPSKLLDRIRHVGQQQLLAQAHLYARRARVAVHAQQASDASSLLEWSVIAFIVVALLSIAVAWWLAGRALRPLRTMNARAREISAENLHERLGLDEDRRDELGELAVTFDALLSRLERAFDSQRRFVANASHELRTPITLERTLAEVALADPDASAESLRRVCERVVASTEQQERLLDALLTLARSEAGIAAGERVDLVALMEEALLAREPLLASIRLERELEPAVVSGDRALLERLIANLLDNAIIHNGDGGGAGWVRVVTGERGGAPGLRIANGGRKLEPEQVEELFEPFRRGNGERVARGEGGLGLGLSIVRAVALAHGGRIDARALPEGGLEFELRMPSPAAVTPLDSVNVYVAQADGRNS
jgi:signal transduction histidine kinase